MKLITILLNILIVAGSLKASQLHSYDSDLQYLLGFFAGVAGTMLLSDLAQVLGLRNF